MASSSWLEHRFTHTHTLSLLLCETRPYFVSLVPFQMSLTGACCLAQAQGSNNHEQYVTNTLDGPRHVPWKKLRGFDLLWSQSLVSNSLFCTTTRELVDVCECIEIMF